MVVASGVDAGGLLARMRSPVAEVPARHFGRAALQTVALPEGGHALVRSCRHGGLLRRITRHWFVSRPPRPFAELAVTAAARERGLATAEVLAALVARGIGPWYRGWLVTRELTGARDLWAALPGQRSGAGTEMVLSLVGRTLRLMHTLGIDHADLNLRNILVRDDEPFPRIYIIDFDKARLFPGAVPDARAQRNLRRLLRSVNKLDPQRRRVRPGDWNRLMAAYRSG